MRPIEDYALISNCRTAALVSKSGSIDWFCAPRFDSAACFAALLGTEDNGCWQIAPVDEIRTVSRRYCRDTLVLETTFTTDSGSAVLLDCLSMREESLDILRLVKGMDGSIKMRMTLKPRFEYGRRLPLICRKKDGLHAISGADQLTLHTPLAAENSQSDIWAEFCVSEGDTIPFQLSHTPSHEPPARAIDVEAAIDGARKFWREWVKDEALDEQIIGDDFTRRSVLTLKALTYMPTGGIVAAPTTSLPESIGEIRNWDYRYCWPRDASLAMHAVVSSGKKDEIEAWREWILRACAGVPSQMEVLYGLSGETPPQERELDWLCGYENSKPVRVGNQAHDQCQLDIYGIVLDIFYTAEKLGLPDLPESWELAVGVLEHLEAIWQNPDKGIWEVRGPARHFVHSKVMVWAAFDRGIKAAKEFGVEGPVERWQEVRDRVFSEVCEKGFDREKTCFVQYYGSQNVDASLLQLPLIGFLPADDPRIIGTVEAIEKELLLGDSWVMRYLPDEGVEGLPPHGQRAFLLCQSWLGIVYAMQGRRKEAERILRQLSEIANDVGLLAEQYDPVAKRMLGNFPQAFSHLGVISLYIALKEFS